MNLGPNVLPVAAGKYLISDFTFIYQKLIIFGVIMHY